MFWSMTMQQLISSGQRTHYQHSIHMPKNITKEGHNWGIEVTKCDPLTGKPIYKPDHMLEKIKICMKDRQFPNSDSQPFYFPEGHSRAGIFKGMAIILEERGFSNILGFEEVSWAPCPAQQNNGGAWETQYCLAVIHESF
ncbi:hypothetical protein CVT25_013163 [Psilocybe cyanescens]|uniref:Uncharacterized protein n=1 Tax=Psilocybe cyanescens TaxID=93625 RepID=A0A409X0G8_PSICY|nr:hypothetical protein CVT25_013163 [Psilocybe cyanescens]